MNPVDLFTYPPRPTNGIRVGMVAGIFQTRSRAFPKIPVHAASTMTGGAEWSILSSAVSGRPAAAGGRPWEASIEVVMGGRGIAGP